MPGPRDWRPLQPQSRSCDCRHATFGDRVHDQKKTHQSAYGVRHAPGTLRASCIRFLKSPRKNALRLHLTGSSASFCQNRFRFEQCHTAHVRHYCCHGSHSHVARQCYRDSVIVTSYECSCEIYQSECAQVFNRSNLERRIRRTWFEP